MPETSFHSQAKWLVWGLITLQTQNRKLRTNKASVPRFCCNMQSHICFCTAIGVVKDSENKSSEAFQVTLDILHPLFLNSASYLNVDEHTLRADAENLKHVQQDLDGKLFPLRCQVIVDTCAHLQHSAPFVSCVSVNEVHHLVLLTRALRSILTLQLPGERRVSQSTGESVL